MTMTPLSKKVLEKIQANIIPVKTKLIEAFGDEAGDISNPSDANGLVTNMWLMKHKNFTPTQSIVLLAELLKVPVAQLQQLHAEIAKGWRPHIDNVNQRITNDH